MGDTSCCTYIVFIPGEYSIVVGKKEFGPNAESAN